MNITWTATGSAGQVGLHWEPTIWQQPVDVATGGQITLEVDLLSANRAAQLRCFLFDFTTGRIVSLPPHDFVFGDERCLLFYTVPG